MESGTPENPMDQLLGIRAELTALRHREGALVYRRSVLIGQMQREGYTLVEIAQKLGVTPQRVRRMRLCNLR